MSIALSLQLPGLEPILHDCHMHREAKIAPFLRFPHLSFVKLIKGVDPGGLGILTP